MIRIADCPEQFIKKLPSPYPPHQRKNPMIEERAYNFFSTEKNIESDYIYIPIHWTAWHINPVDPTDWWGYGQNKQPLIDFCNELTEKHPNEKFFTVVQYDGGTLIPIDNCKIFAASGAFGSHPFGKNSVYERIPLLCDPHEGTPKTVKQYKVGYVGRNSHEIRDKMNQILSHVPQYKLVVSGDCDNTEIFHDILYDSVFALCPRGYGPASFRMYEAIQMQCIPIYVSDAQWLPFTEYIEWDKMCLLITSDQIETIPEKVDALLESGQYQNMIDYGQEIYKKHLTWDGCLNTIARMIC